MDFFRSCGIEKVYLPQSSDKGVPRQLLTYLRTQPTVQADENPWIHGIHRAKMPEKARQYWDF
jgi:hypothetical protein